MGTIKIAHQKLVGSEKLASNDAIKFYNRDEQDIQYLDLAGLTNFMESNINAENLGLQSYSDFFRGSFASDVSMPALGTLGQWLIRTDSDTLYVWDLEGSAWKQTGAASGGVADNAHTFVYSATDGSGYGFVNVNGWQGNPDATLTKTDTDGAVGVATLKNPGDYFEIRVTPTASAAASNRFTLLMSVPGSTYEEIGFKNTNTLGTGKGFHATDPSKVIGHNTFMGVYIGMAPSYASGMSAPGHWVYPGNQSDFTMGYRVDDDYRISLIVDGNDTGSRTSTPINGGVDVWAFRDRYGDLNQPTGALINNPTNTNAATGSASKFWMSQVSSPSGATQMAVGNGYYLYSRSTAGNGADVELTAPEATVALGLRVFQDYAGMTSIERAATATAVYKKDVELLESVKDLASGYFHTLDLDVPGIQAKMAAYGPALSAAAAGSVEVTQAALSVVIPGDADEAQLIGSLQVMLAGHLAKFPR